MRPKGTYVWAPIPREQLWTWYWEDFLTLREIGERWATRGSAKPMTTRKYPTAKWVQLQLERYGIPQRDPTDRARLWQGAKTRKRFGPAREHRAIFEAFYRVTLESSDEVHHRDFVDSNNHPLNLEAFTKASHAHLHGQAPEKPERIPIFEVYMRMAEMIATRSHDQKTRVGCVVTSFDLRRVLAVGFNGNARGLLNARDSNVPGQSQLIHAEENALIYAGEHGSDRVAFVTRSPCLQCTKLLVNAGVKYVYYRKRYRDEHPIRVGRYLGLMLCEYRRWEKTKW